MLQYKNKIDYQIIIIILKLIIIKKMLKNYLSKINHKNIRNTLSNNINCVFLTNDYGNRNIESVRKYFYNHDIKFVLTNDNIMKSINIAHNYTNYTGENSILLIDNIDKFLSSDINGHNGIQYCKISSCMNESLQSVNTESAKSLLITQDSCLKSDLTTNTKLIMESNKSSLLYICKEINIDNYRHIKKDNNIPITFII